MYIEILDSDSNCVYLANINGTWYTISYILTEHESQFTVASLEILE